MHADWGAQPPGIGDVVKVQHFVQGEVQSFHGTIMCIRAAAGRHSAAIVPAPVVYYTVASGDSESTVELTRQQFDTIEHYEL